MASNYLTCVVSFSQLYAIHILIADTDQSLLSLLSLSLLDLVNLLGHPDVQSSSLLLLFSSWETSIGILE